MASPLSRSGILRRGPTVWLSIALLFAGVSIAANASAVAFVSLVDASGATGGLLVGSEVLGDLGFSDFGTPTFEPGTLDVTLVWGGTRESLDSVGALVLNGLPSLLDSRFSLTTGQDCTDGIGQPSGTCTISMSTSVPGITAAQLLRISFFYLWLPPDGFEFCDPGSSGDCVLANSLLADLDVTNVAGNGEPGFAQSDFGVGVTTFGGIPHVRPIPEPGPAGLVGLGLALLGRRRRATRDGDR